MKSLMLLGRISLLMLSSVFCTTIAEAQIKLGVEARTNASKFLLEI